MPFEIYGWWKDRLHWLWFQRMVLLWLGFSVLTVGAFMLLGARIGSWIAPWPYERWELKALRDGRLIMEQFGEVMRPRGEEPGSVLGVMVGFLVCFGVVVYGPKLLRRVRQQSPAKPH